MSKVIQRGMIFLCEESCQNTRDGEGWRGGKEYDLSSREVDHLYEIGHLKRFKPLNETAIQYHAKVTGQDTGEKAIKDMSLDELLEKAEELGLELSDDVTRAEVVEILTNAINPSVPNEDKPLTDLTLKELLLIATDKKIAVPRNVKKAQLIALIEKDAQGAKE